MKRGWDGRERIRALAVKTSDKPYILNLASGALRAELQASTSASLSRAETHQFTLLQLSL